MSLHLSERTLDELRDRHVAFLLDRLSSDAGREDWRRCWREGWAWLLTRPVRDVVDPAHLADALVRVLSHDSTRTLFAPVARDIAARVLAVLKEDETSLGSHVPAQARQAIDHLLARPDLVPRRLVRELLVQEAVENALRDVLYDGLKEFHDTVNPFFAEWGIPALTSWMPIGGAAVRASMNTLRAEFDRRLEPEMRKFLLVFSRKAALHLAEVFVARSNDPNLVALRKHMVGFLLARSVKDMASPVDDEAFTDLADLTEAVVLEALASAGLGEDLRKALEHFVAENAGVTVGQWLDSIGASGQPDFEAWADLAWPQVRLAIDSPVVRSLVEGITAEFYASLKH